jgi:hypothetical protein
MLLRSPTGGVASLEVGTSLDQQLHHTQVSVHTGDEERRPRIRVLCQLRVGPLIVCTVEKGLGTLTMPKPSCHMERGFALVILIIDINTSSNQELDDIDIVRLGGKSQHGTGFGDVPTNGRLGLTCFFPILCIEQSSRCQRVTAHDTQMQRRPALVILPVLAVDSFGDIEHVPRLQMLNDDLADDSKPILSSKMKRRSTGNVPGKEGASLMRAEIIQDMLQ